MTAFDLATVEAGLAVSVGSVSSMVRRSMTDAVERHLDQRVAGIVVIAPVASANEALDHLPAVGFDDVPEAGCFIPPLTTVRQAFDEVARATVKILLARLECERPSSEHRSIAPTW